MIIFPLRAIPTLTLILGRLYLLNWQLCFTYMLYVDSWIIRSQSTLLRIPLRRGNRRVLPSSLRVSVNCHKSLTLG
jgi:hypothetical protein